MFASGTIPTIKDAEGRTYINLVGLVAHLLMTAKAMEAEVKSIADGDPLTTAQGIGMVETLYMLTRNLAEVGLFESAVEQIENSDNVIDLFGPR